MVNKLMEVHGSNIACGYDIGCTFSKTLSSSSLGPRAAELGFRLVVGSFHGHAHNRACQLDWHPHHVTGMGRADFEGCERIFASSNALAPGTRHASSFHRHQAIEQHFAFWDEDKYAALSESQSFFMTLS
jgi:Kyakuja-Dileera-Zisupton transposase